jgi:hypothetical protein
MHALSKDAMDLLSTGLVSLLIVSISTYLFVASYALVKNIRKRK